MFRSDNSRLFVIGFVAGMVLFGGCDTTDYSGLEQAEQQARRIAELEQENKDLKKQLALSDVGTLATNDTATSVENSTPTEDSGPSNNGSSESGRPTAKESTNAEPTGLSLADEKSIVAELESADAYFSFDDGGRAIEADFKECRDVNPLLNKVVEFPNLTKVLLDGNRIDSETFKLLAKVNALEYLDLERSTPTADDFRRLQSLPNLSFLQLFKATLDEDACAALAEFPALEQIRCAQTRVGDAELVHLSKIESLRAIDLSDCNRVTPAGLESLANGCPKLVFLKVWGKSIGNQSMDIVARMRSLRVLGLVDTAVDDEGIKKLADLNLSEIHLFRTSVGDDGIKILASMPNMTTMNLRDTKVSDASMETIAGLKKLRKLDLSECTSPGVTDASAKAISQIESLQQLNLWSTKITDAGVAEFESMKNLTWLNLDHINVTDKSAEVLSRMKQLKWIHLGKTKITDAAVPFLKKLPNLEYLDVSNTEISQDSYYDLLDSLPEDCELIGP